MKRKHLKLALAAACLLLALLLCLWGASHLIWGRSLQATVYEQLLRHRNAHPRTAEQEDAVLRARLEAGEKPVSLPDDLHFKSEIVETEREGMQFFTLNPDGPGPLIVYLHGGAYVHGFSAYQWRYMDRLAAATGSAIVALAYHLAPFGDYARAYEDLSGLWADLVAAHPGRRILLMGDSAGGGLALGLGESLVKQGARLPERLILFSPWVDISMENPDIADYVAVDPILHLDLVTLHGRYWAGSGDVHDWQASPLFGDMAGLPPVTIYLGTRELLYPDILLAHEKLLAAGVEAELRIGRGLNHDYPLMPLPEAERAFREVVKLIETRASGPQARTR